MTQQYRYRRNPSRIRSRFPALTWVLAIVLLYLIGLIFKHGGF